MTWVATVHLDAAAEHPVRFDHGGHGILIAVVDGEPHAYEDACLHKGVSLAEGVCAGGYLTCPSHWWRYDLRDGALQGSPGVHLPSYSCRIVDGTIEVELPATTRTPSLREVLLAHAREGRAGSA